MLVFAARFPTRRRDAKSGCCSPSWCTSASLVNALPTPSSSRPQLAAIKAAPTPGEHGGGPFGRTPLGVPA